MKKKEKCQPSFLIAEVMKQDDGEKQLETLVCKLRMDQIGDALL